MHQLVFRRPQTGMAGRRAPTGGIDQRLGMLNPHSNRKRLGFNLNADLFEHGKAISSRVARCQNEVAAGDGIAIGQLEANQLMALLAPIGFQAQPLDAAAKANFSTQGLNTSAQPPHHRGQLEGADVGALQGENVLIGTRCHQFLEHLASVVLRITHLAVELSIRERSGATLSKLGVGLWINACFSTPEREGLQRALFHRLPALQ